MKFFKKKKNKILLISLILISLIGLFILGYAITVEKRIEKLTPSFSK